MYEQDMDELEKATPQLVIEWIYRLLIDTTDGDLTTNGTFPERGLVPPLLC